MTPSDPNRPARPKRRFSALKPAIRPAPATDSAFSAESHARPEPTSPVEAAVAAESAPQVEPPAPPRAPRLKAPTAGAAAPSKGAELARVAKVMARAGLCSRRDAEAWIGAGRVAVNGEVLASPARDVGPGDVVTVDGYPIDKPERTRLFLFNKARGLVTTSRDPEGRPTVFDALPADLPRLMTIGRLDINTEGLLLLTNDGGLARLLELPATGWIRRYRVRAHGAVDQAQLDALAKGITVEGVAYAGIAAKLDRMQGSNLWLTMGLKEGKNREIKRVLEHLGLAVTRLIRISYGPFQLGELADNAVEEVRTRVLRDQLGTALVKQAGLDLDSPLDQERTATPKAAPPDQPPRRQTRRTATADRRGRAVAVERISTVAPAGGRRAEEGRPRPPKGDRPPRRWHDSPDEKAGAPGRPPRSASGRAGSGDAPARRRDPDQGSRPPRAGAAGPSRPSRSGAPAGPGNRAERRRTASPAVAPRSEGPSRGARPDRAARPDREGRPGRGTDGAPRGGRGGPDGPGRDGGGSRGGGKRRPRG